MGATVAKKKTAKKKTTRKKSTAKAKSASGAKVNKSAAIREFAAKNPGMGPTAIAKALNAEGIQLSPSFVSVVLTSKKKSSKRGPGRPRKQTRASSTGAALTIDQLKAAKKFATAMGGIGQAKSALDALAAVMDA